MPLSLQTPEQIQRVLARRFVLQRGRWLQGAGTWPMPMPLGMPTESEAERNLDLISTWAREWQDWRGPGEIKWEEKRWRVLGSRRIPRTISFNTPAEIAALLGKASEWKLAVDRYESLSTRWPALSSRLGTCFDVLAQYEAEEFRKLTDTLEWLERNPQSQLYVRQLPIPNIDTKWFESRQSLVAELLMAIQGAAHSETDTLRVCGLKGDAPLVRIRLLDSELRSGVGGLRDFAALPQELKKLALPIRRVYLVENVQSGLCFDELRGAAVFMGLGFAVDLLAEIKWLHQIPLHYWGDLDTYGFAILSKARNIWPHLESLLMDEGTLLRHKSLWVREEKQHPAQSLSGLNPEEEHVYAKLKSQAWGTNVRLEQERIPWPEAWRRLSGASG